MGTSLGMSGSADYAMEWWQLAIRGRLRFWNLATCGSHSSATYFGHFGTMAAADPPYSATDLAPGLERDLLNVWFDAAAAQDPRLDAPETALAWVKGPGLPWENVWVPAAGAVAQLSTMSLSPISDHDIRWLLDRAGAYVVEDLGPGERSGAGISQARGVM